MKTNRRHLFLVLTFALVLTVLSATPLTQEVYASTNETAVAENDDYYSMYSYYYNDEGDIVIESEAFWKITESYHDLENKVKHLKALTAILGLSTIVSVSVLVATKARKKNPQQ